MLKKFNCDRSKDSQCIKKDTFRGSLSHTFCQRISKFKTYVMCRVRDLLELFLERDRTLKSKDKRNILILTLTI